MLKAARAAFDGRIIAVVQPHRYSRLRNLFEDFCTCFNDADWVVVADVYAAGEEPIEGIDKNTLIEGLRNRGHRRVGALDGPEMLAEMVADGAKPGDVVIFLGAGTVTNWAYALAGELESKLAARGAENRAART